MVSMSSTSAPDLRLTVGKRASRCRRASSTSNRRLRRRVRGRTKVNATSASKPVTEPNSRRATFTRDDAKNETMQMSALRPKEKNGKASNNAFISVPVTKKSAPSSTNQTTTFLSPQFTEGLVIAIACLLGSSLSATLLALVPTLRAAATALNEVALLAEALKEEIPDTLAAVRVSGLELTDALEEVGELTSEVTGVTKRTTKAIDRSLTTAQRVGGMVYEGSKTMVPNAKKQMKRTVKPIVRRTADEIEDIAKERAKMEPYAGEVLSGVASTTKKGVGRARKAIEAAGVAKKIGKVYKSVKGKSPKVSD